MLVSNMNEPERTITIVATLAGLRIGERLGLRWGRVHLDQCTLEVEETCYKGVFGTPKSKASRRGTPLAPVVVQALDAHRSRCKDTSANALVFSKGGNEPLSADNLRKKRLASACRRAGLRRIDWHTLRHTYSTLLHDLGTPIRVQQTLLGHSSAQQQWTFTHTLFPLPNAMRSQDWARFCSQLFPTCTTMQQARKREAR